MRFMDLDSEAELESDKEVQIDVNLDNSKIEEFQQKMVSTLSNAFTILLLSVGNRTGLLDCLADLPPSTYNKIATASDLHPRYVLEWLNGMVCAGIIDYNPRDKSYSLAPEKAMVITSKAGLGNMAFFAQTLHPITVVENDIVESFKHGGGVSYDHPHGRDVLRVFNEWTEQNWDKTLLKATIPVVPGLEERLQQGINVLDLGCGYGHATNLMAKSFPNSQFVGYDISEEGILQGNEEKKRLGLENATFKIQNVEEMNEALKYQFIVAFDSIHDQVKPDLVLENIYNSLADEGVFLMVDIKASTDVENNIENPVAPWLYTVSLFHCMSVSLANGGKGLGSMWGKQKAIEMVETAGFGKVEVKEIETDPFNYYYICKK